jgi:spermidine/putrescine transport system permease protein
VNNTLVSLGLIDHPLSFFLYSRLGVMIVLSCMLLPFAIVPIHAALSNVSRELLEAARDLGAGPADAVRTVLLPIAHKGVFSGFAFAFVLSAGDYVTAQLVGGTSTQMVGNIIVDQFGANFDWPLASAIGVITTVVAGLVLLLAAAMLRGIVK